MNAKAYKTKGKKLGISEKERKVQVVEDSQSFD